MGKPPDRCSNTRKQLSCEKTVAPWSSRGDKGLNWMKLMAFEGKAAMHCLSLKGVGTAENPGEPRVVLR